VSRPKIQLEEDQLKDRQDEKNNTRHHQRKCSAGLRSCRNILAPTVGPRRKTPRIVHMVNTRNMTGNDRNAQEETSRPDPMTLILKMQQEMEALRKENARMKEKLAEKPKILEAMDNIPSGDHANTDTHEVGSSYQENIRSASNNALNAAPRRSPFTETILEVPLPGTWNNPTLDKYDGSTDPDEHVMRT